MPICCPPFKGRDVWGCVWNGGWIKQGVSSSILNVIYRLKKDYGNALLMSVSIEVVERSVWLEISMW